MIIDERNSRGDVIRFEKHLLTPDSKLMNLAGAESGVLTDVTTTVNQTGEANSAQTYNGSTSVVRIPDFAGANVGASLSVMTTIKIPSVAAGVSTFVGQYDTGANQRGWFIGREAAKLRATITGNGLVSGATKNYLSVASLVINTFYRVGFSFSPNSLKLYINGLEVSVTKETDNTVNSCFNSSADITLGGILNSNALFVPMTGTQCDTIIKDVTLTAEEFYDDYLEFLG